MTGSSASTTLPSKEGEDKKEEAEKEENVDKEVEKDKKVGKDEKSAVPSFYRPGGVSKSCQFFLGPTHNVECNSFKEIHPSKSRVLKKSNIFP